MWIHKGGGGGGAGGPDLLKNYKKYRVSKQFWSGSPEKAQSYQASISCWAIIGTPAKMPFKWRFAGGQMMAGLLWYLDPFSPHQLKIKKTRQSWTPSRKTLWIRTCLKSRNVCSGKLTTKKRGPLTFSLARYS